jgi:hypothetical protein
MTETTNGATVLDTPAQISMWVFRSRMSQLAIEIVTGMKSSRGPILAAMYREGLIDVNLRGTKINKQRVLRMMCESMAEAHAASSVEWVVPASIQRALDA